MEQALLLSSLGAVLALDNAMLGQFMLSQPLVVGGIFGALLGILGIIGGTLALKKKHWGWAIAGARTRFSVLAGRCGK